MAGSRAPARHLRHASWCSPHAFQASARRSRHPTARRQNAVWPTRVFLPPKVAADLHTPLVGNRGRRSAGSAVYQSSAGWPCRQENLRPRWPCRCLKRARRIEYGQFISAARLTALFGRATAGIPGLLARSVEGRRRHGSILEGRQDMRPVSRRRRKHIGTFAQATVATLRLRCASSAIGARLHSGSGGPVPGPRPSPHSSARVGTRNAISSRRNDIEVEIAEPPSAGAELRAPHKDIDTPKNSPGAVSLKARARFAQRRRAEVACARLP